MPNVLDQSPPSVASTSGSGRRFFHFFKRYCAVTTPISRASLPRGATTQTQIREGSPGLVDESREMPMPSASNLSTPSGLVLTRRTSPIFFFVHHCATGGTPREPTHFGVDVAPFHLDRCLAHGLSCSFASTLDFGPSDHRPIVIDLQVATGGCQAPPTLPRQAPAGADPRGIALGQPSRNRLTFPPPRA